MWCEYHLSKAVGSIVVVSALTCCALHAMCNLKATQMNMEHHLIWELRLYELKQGHDPVEITKNVCCMKGEVAID